MNVSEKEKQQKVINVVILGIESFTKEIVSDRDKFREAMNSFNVQGSEGVEGDYTQSYHERKKNETVNNYKAKMQDRYQNMVIRLENLRKLILERDAVLDLSNPALTNALSLIQSISGNMAYEECLEINSNFIHDQRGLRALRAAYTAHGVLSQGNIDDMIYNINERINELLDLAEAGTILDATMYEFTLKLSKFAALEGLTVESAISDSALEEAMRRGAGMIR